jgi:hypothetical protein
LQLGRGTARCLPVPLAGLSVHTRAVTVMRRRARMWLEVGTGSHLAENK